MTSGGMPENPVERIRHNLVGLRMPRALEALGGIIQQIERGQISAIEAIDTLLAEEITVREGRRIKAALQMARLATIKTLTGVNAGAKIHRHAGAKLHHGWRQQGAPYGAPCCASIFSRQD